MQDQLSLVFSALADPTRRAIIARLSSSAASVSELAEPFLNDMSLPAITKHLKVLETAGLISKTREAQWRHCKLNHAGFQEVADWLDEYKVFWEESFDRLDAHLKRVMSENAAKGQDNANDE